MIGDRCLAQVCSIVSFDGLETSNTGVLRVVAADAALQQPPSQVTTANPPTTDATTPIHTITTKQALRSHAALMPQLRSTLSDVGLTLPWPHHPQPCVQPPPAPPDEASSAPNLKTMVEELARLSTQGSTLVQEQQDCSMRRYTDSAPEAARSPADTAPPRETHAPSGGLVPKRSPTRRARRASPSPGAHMCRCCPTCDTCRTGAAAMRRGVEARLKQMQALSRAGCKLVAVE